MWSQIWGEQKEEWAEFEKTGFRENQGFKRRYGGGEGDRGNSKKEQERDGHVTQGKEGWNNTLIRQSQQENWKLQKSTASGGCFPSQLPYWWAPSQGLALDLCSQQDAPWLVSSTHLPLNCYTALLASLLWKPETSSHGKAFQQLRHNKPPALAFLLSFPRFFNNVIGDENMDKTDKIPAHMELKNLTGEKVQWINKQDIA